MMEHVHKLAYFPLRRCYIFNQSIFYSLLGENEMMMMFAEPLLSNVTEIHL